MSITYYKFLSNCNLERISRINCQKIYTIALMIFMSSLEDAHERWFHHLLFHDDLLSISKFLALKKMSPENVKFFRISERSKLHDTNVIRKIWILEIDYWFHWLIVSDNAYLGLSVLYLPRFFFVFLVQNDKIWPKMKK